MTMYALIANGAIAQYPYSVTDLRRAHPNVSFSASPSDAALEDFGVYPVDPIAAPAYDPLTQKLAEDTPVEVAGRWQQAWSVVALTPAEIAAAQQALQDDIVAQTQARLDTFAQTRNYDGILSACTYATSTVATFQAEGQYCVEARDDTWSTLYTILAEVQAGTRPVPTGYADIEPDLPVLAWPV